ncbi:MAG: DUF1631 family protein [Proteobacteria bacterium]|nr:DUF1631 family protein [Pseudomonadota bacterium]
MDGKAASPPLSRRARSVLDTLYADARKELEYQLPRIIEATALSMSEPVPAGKPELEAARITSLRSLGDGSRMFVQRFLAHVEAAFKLSRSGHGETERARSEAQAEALSLVLDDAPDNIGTLLENTALRLASRNSLALQLLGQRFGVLARAPAFEPELLPLGPNTLCEGLAKSVEVLDLALPARQQLIFQFEKSLVDAYPTLLDSFNASLARAGILPFLSYVPVRRHPGASPGTWVEDDEAESLATPIQPPEVEAITTRITARVRSEQRAPIDASFATLQSLMQRRRAVLAKLRPGSLATTEREKNLAPLAHDDVVDALKRLRSTNTRAENVQEYRQILLAQARQQQGRGVALTEKDEDSFDLLALFLAQLKKGLRRTSPGNALTDKLFLPMLLSAVRDPGFFTNREHPARELLDAVSLSGARWLAEDDLDPQWLGLLQRAVTSVQNDKEGSPESIAESNRTLQSGLQTLLRKSEMAERRQVEAARGRERLAIARMCAGDAISALLGDRTLPEFHDVFIHHAWADVLSLTYLRGGDESDAWRELVGITNDIIESGFTDATHTLPSATLTKIGAALEQVGYHSDDTTAITRTLNAEAFTSAPDPERTQLLEKLGTRARLGEDSLGRKEEQQDLQHPAVQRAYDQLRNAEMPAWIEFTSDPERPLRRRLAWVGEASGQALLVNRRGLRAEDATLVGLARKLAAGDALLLDGDTSPAKSAWESTLESLQPLAHGHDKTQSEDMSDGH